MKSQLCPFLDLYVFNSIIKISEYQTNLKFKFVVAKKFNQIGRRHRWGRFGSFQTASGVVLTPTFMPVATYGSLRATPLALLAESRIDVLLANAYHIGSRPGPAVINQIGGIHRFMNWPGPILTDSGGFQVFSLAHQRRVTEAGVEFRQPQTGATIFLSPEDSVRIQFEIGSDIIMALDDVVSLKPDSTADVARAVDRTHRWLDRCLIEFQRLVSKTSRRPLLYGICQGGLDPKQRQKSLDYIQKTAVDGIAIGGLSVGEPKVDMYRVLADLAPFYDPDRPRYLMGVGDPPDLRQAFEMGIDMADCVLPTRNGRHGNVYTTGDRRLNLRNSAYKTDPGPIDKSCDCPVCRDRWSRGWFNHQFRLGDPIAGGLAAIHNIHYLQKLAIGYRQSDSDRGD